MAWGWGCMLTSLPWRGVRVAGSYREPARAFRVAVVGVAAELPVQLGVLTHLVTIEPDAKPRCLWHCDLPVDISEFAAHDNIVHEVMVVGVGGEDHIGQGSAQVQNRGELDAKFAARVDRNAKLEC